MLSQGGFHTPESYFTPVSCSIVFGVAGWTTTMEGLDSDIGFTKRVLTKHHF